MRWTRLRRASALVAVLVALAALSAVLTGGGGPTPTQAIVLSNTTTTTAPIVIDDPPPPGSPPGPLRAFTATVGPGLNNGRTRIEQSLGCTSGGDANYWHFQSEAPLPSGVLNNATPALPGDLRLYADVHSAHHAIRTNPEPVGGPTVNAAFLLPDASHVGMSNPRGTVKLRLNSGECGGLRNDQGSDGPTLDFDGTVAKIVHSGPSNATVPTWELVSSGGSYRGAVATGYFDLNVDVSPGADNPWKLVLNGTIAVRQPRLTTSIVDTYWGRDGVDYAKRQVAVVYEVTNVGSGDAFDVLLKTATSPTPGGTLVAIIINGDNLLIDGNTPLGTFPRTLGDLASGERTHVTLKWQLPLPANKPPCFALVLNCKFKTTLGFVLPDALDVPVTPAPSFTLEAKAPNLPPPL